jgi:hypothetical protein
LLDWNAAWWLMSIVQLCKGLPKRVRFPATTLACFPTTTTDQQTGASIRDVETDESTLPVVDAVADNDPSCSSHCNLFMASLDCMFQLNKIFEIVSLSCLHRSSRKRPFSRSSQEYKNVGIRVLALTNNSRTIERVTITQTGESLMICSL